MPACSAAALFAEATDMSCFEGACGYFAFFMGLFALLAGAVAGGIFAVWRVNRRRASPSGLIRFQIRVWRLHKAGRAPYLIALR